MTGMVGTGTTFAQKYILPRIFLKCILLKIGSFFSKKIIEDKGGKISWGFAPHPTGPPGRPGDFCLFAGLLAGHDRGDRRMPFSVRVPCTCLHVCQPVSPDRFPVSASANVILMWALRARVP